MKVPTYDEKEISVGTAVLPQFTNRPADTSAEGAAISGLGLSIAAASREFEQERDRVQNETDQLWALNRMASLRGEALTDFQDRVQKMEPGGGNFADEVNKSYSQLLDGALKDAPNDRSRKYLASHGYQYASQLFAHSIAEQAREAARNKLVTTKDAADVEAESIRLDPTLLDGLTKDRLASIEMFPPEMKDQIHTYMSNQFIKSYLSKMILEDPRDAAEKINDGTYTAHFQKIGLKVDPDIMRSLGSIAGTKAKANDQVLQGQIQDLIRSDVSSTLQTGVRVQSPLLSEKIFKTAWGDSAGEARWNDYKQKAARAKSVYNVVRDTELAPFDKAVERLAKIAPVPGSKDYDDQQAIYAAAAQTVYNNQKALHDDPFAHVQRVIDRAELGNVGRLSKQGVLEPQNNRSEIAENLAIQSQAGIPSDLQRVVPNQIAKDLAAQLNTLPPDKVQAALTALEVEYGPEYYPVLLKHLSKSGLKNDVNIAAWISPTPVGNLGLDAMRTSYADAKVASGLAEPDIRAAQERIAEGLAPFQRIFFLGGTSSARVAQWNDIRGMVEKAVLIKTGQMGGGLSSMKDATEAVIRPILLDRYEFQDTYMIPRELQGPGGINLGVTNTDLVKSRLARLKTKDLLERFGVAAFGTKIGLQDEYELRRGLVDTAADSGYWVNSETGDGLYLVVNAGPYQGLPVRNKKGERYEFRFVDLTNPEPGYAEGVRVGKISRPK